MEQETTGQKAITLKEQNWSIPFSMLFARRLKAAIAFKVSSLHIPLEVEPAPEWELCLSPKFVKSTPIVS